jgi:hypothetical protein
MRSSYVFRAGKGMSKTKRFNLIVAALFALHASSADCAQLTGVVTSRRGLPLQDVKVIVKDATGKVVKTVYTDKNGIYRADGLKPAVYTYTVDGGQIGFRGGNETIAHLPPEGLNIDWTMTSTSALATATNNPNAMRLGSDSAANFFSGMTGPIGPNGTSANANNGTTDPTTSSATSASGGSGLPGGPSGIVGGVPIGAVIIPIAKAKKGVSSPSQ